MSRTRSKAGEGMISASEDRSEARSISTSRYTLFSPPKQPKQPLEHQQTSPCPPTLPSNRSNTSTESAGMLHTSDLSPTAASSPLFMWGRSQFSFDLAILSMSYFLLVSCHQIHVVTMQQIFSPLVSAITSNKVALYPGRRQGKPVRC